MAALLLATGAVSHLLAVPEEKAFYYSGAVAVTTGMIMMLLSRKGITQLNSRQLCLMTTCSWLTLSMAGALPFLFSHYHYSITDAMFEAVSGITTTGSTVLTGLQDMPHSLLTWRSILQWIGGIGVISMAVSILPFLRVGGMRLFQTESSDWSDKSLPRFQNLVVRILQIYILITFLCTVSFQFCGMSFFDAINHAMTTVSTGGFATHDLSMSRFGSNVLWVCTLFMLIGGLPFTFFVRLLASRSMSHLFDQQVVGFLSIIALVTILQAFYLSFNDILEFGTALTQSAFNVTSVITTTGYSSTDYTLWGQFSIGIFFIITFIGGCSGSTAGGMKIFRFQLSFLFLRDQFRKLVHPRGIFSISYNGQVVQEDVIFSVIAFSFIFFLSLAVMSIMLAAVGVDFMTSISAVSTALANVGPGIGDVIGPSGNFSSLPDSAKWILAFAMILGRLEMITVIVLFSTAYWRA